VELASNESLKTMRIGSCTDGDSERNPRIMFEGMLGKLNDVSMVEGSMLEIRGTEGILRIDIDEEELQKMFRGVSTS